MAQLSYPERTPTERTTGAPTTEAVLATFDTYQPKTAGMVAEEFEVAETTAARILDRLVRRGDLTKARGSTETPVWLRPDPTPSPARTV
jgi:predicted ArsR family transcriptional regulator